MTRSGACFLIGATGPGVTATGEALIGSVSDDPYDVRTFVRIVNPRGMLPHVGSELVSTTDVTLAERGYFSEPGETSRGINQAGLGFTCALVFEQKPQQASPEPAKFGRLIHEMMTRCKTVSDAVELFRQAGASAPAFSVLLADAQGDLAHVETGAFGVSLNHHFTREKPGMVFAVNCYLSQQLAGHNQPDAALANAQNNNQVRRQRGQHLAQQDEGSLDVGTFARILSDHANGERDPLNNPLLPAWGYSICNHGTRGRDDYPPSDLPWGTVSAEILQPAAGLFWYAYGWPCGAKPKYGDQLFQQGAWGRFVPFSLELAGGDSSEIIALTTAEGAITPAGEHNAAHRSSVSGT